MAESDTQLVRVELGERSYEIRIGSGILGSLGAWLREVLQPSRLLVVTDENVVTLYAATILDSLRAQGFEANLIAVPAGEGSKSLESIADLWRQAFEAGADRKSAVIALGGGVVGDLAGFLAATFARGIPLVQVPTTLLAQVDSSVGGKVGVNLPQGKNMVGAFHQPAGVLIDTHVLATLPEREYRAGLAEVVKYGVILDAEFFKFLEGHVSQTLARDGGVLRDVIARCCELKALVVETDEFEQLGQRAALNYGHTFCHAFEAATGYQSLLHGEGVAIGMLCASRLAERLGRIGPDVTVRQKNLLEALGLPTVVPDVSPDRLLELMLHDKKAERGAVRFVLPDRLGHVELVENVAEHDVRAALSA